MLAESKGGMLIAYSFYKHFMKRDAPFHKSLYNVLIPSELFRPICKAKCFSLRSEFESSSRIPILLRLRRPFAIIRGIVSIVVNSFNRISIGRFFAHIFKKACEAFSPRFNKLYAPLCVTSTYAASPNNTSPRVVFCGFIHAVLSLNEAALLPFSQAATATFSISSHERGCANSGNFPAIAFTVPNYSTPIIMIKRTNQQVAELLTCSVFVSSFHKLIIVRN